jgi:hypothetical protein
VAVKSRFCNDYANFLHRRIRLKPAPGSLLKPDT